MEESRRKAVETTRLRYGADFFKRISKNNKNNPFSDPEKAREAARKRWAKEQDVSGK